MSQVIASTYEIIKEIGAGGGCTVYLANHLRLGRKVILKAIKRSAAGFSRLRREADVLKELKHRNIPQVYDFFADGDTVYIAIEYLEGETLDKPLKRGERFSQSQVIRWATQLLEVLCYLHSSTHGEPSKAFIHGDIKPSNILRTSKGDICLLDFGLTTTVGENRIIGYSLGYASPEQCEPVFFDDTTYLERETLDEMHTQEQDAGSFNILKGEEIFFDMSREKKAVLDVRSDIYSLGATLYHLLSGVRPARNAADVIPLSPKEFSPQVVKIITKAMKPDPSLRYQTALEMLDEFQHLRERDERVLKRKRRNICVNSIFLCLFMTGTIASCLGYRKIFFMDEKSAGRGIRGKGTRKIRGIEICHR